MESGKFSRIRRNPQINDKNIIKLAAGYHYSMYSNSAIQFFNAPDPRPDYYRQLPSFMWDGQIVDSYSSQLFNDNGDHYPYGLDHDAPPGSMPYLSELYGYTVTNYMERDHSRLIIWSGCLEDMDPIIVDNCDIIGKVFGVFRLM